MSWLRRLWSGDSVRFARQEAQIDHLANRREYWRNRALAMEMAAVTAVNSYEAIGMGPAGWNKNDRDGFRLVRDILAKYADQGSEP